MVDPQTPEEWQDAVEVAEVYLLVDSARQYGLVEGGPVVNVDRCVEILERGAALGYKPTRAGVDARIERMVRGDV